jgi:acetyl esterase
MIGRTYLERPIGADLSRRLPPSPVVVLARWGKGKGVIRNVLIQRADGSLVIRPFRGLRRSV